MRDLPLPTFPFADLTASTTRRRSLHPSTRTRAHPPVESGFDVVWARDEADVRQAQRLRHLVFAEEMGATLTVPAGSPPGHDIDRYDPYCEHLLVRARVPGQARGPLIGTYRVLTPANAAPRRGLVFRKRIRPRAARAAARPHGRTGPFLRAPGPSLRRRHPGPVGGTGRVHAAQRPAHDDRLRQRHHARRRPFRREPVAAVAAPASGAARVAGGALARAAGGRTGTRLVGGGPCPDQGLFALRREDPRCPGMGSPISTPRTCR